MKIYLICDSAPSGRVDRRCGAGGDAAAAAAAGYYGTGSEHDGG